MNFSKSNIFIFYILQGVHNAVIEAEVKGEVETFNWIIKETPKTASGASFDKDTFVIADLGVKFGRYHLFKSPDQQEYLKTVFFKDSCLAPAQRHRYLSPSLK